MRNSPLPPRTTVLLLCHERRASTTITDSLLRDVERREKPWLPPILFSTSEAINETPQPPLIMSSATFTTTTTTHSFTHFSCLRPTASTTTTRQHSINAETSTLCAYSRILRVFKRFGSNYYFLQSFKRPLEWWRCTEEYIRK